MKHLLLASFLAFATVAQAQNVGYQTPPKAIADLVEAPLTPRISLSSDGKWMAMMAVQDMPSVADLSQPELRLAGLRINPRTNGPSRVSYSTGLMLRRLDTGKDMAVLNMPQQARITDVVWSPDNSKLAFCHTTGTGAEGRIELWVVDVNSFAARRIPGISLNAVFGTPYEWVSDNQTLVVRALVAGRGAAPANAAPTGPAVQENAGKKAGARTYQDLLRNPTDERLFQHYATSQMVRVTLDGKLQPISQPGIIQSALPSPNGKYILVKTRHQPFSYTLPVSSFPLKTEVYDLTTGDQVKQLADAPLADNVPTAFDAVPTGQRGHGWRSDAPATVYWAEAQDGGDPKTEAAIRDKVFTLTAPFAGNAEEFAALPLRYDGVTWGNNSVALVYGSRWADRKEITWRVTPGALPSLAVLFDRSSQNKYGDPGNAYTKRNAQGQQVLLTDPASKTIYFTGVGASPEGDRPFVDELDLATKKTTRWWRSEAPFYEVPVAILDAEKRRLLTRREAVDQAPNYYVRETRGGKVTAVTKFPNPYAAFGGSFKKQVLRYKRADGVDLTANLYLPLNYKPADGPLPTLLEAYPVEFKDKSNAGQVSGSPYAFTRIGYGSPIFWVTQGYAVLQGTSIPIVGEGTKEPNDTYTEQLVSSAKAAIDEGKRLGVVDPNRVAVMGHSYGAFMTANLLAHSNLFKAGIARSGAYNRTLTPFGFQGEERTYWQAPEVYNAMSPFNYADKIKTPILLIHGELDNNSGTFPIQSERFYSALKGHGATTRYVVLPAESHGYAARENIMHMLWEMNAWLDKYVKTPQAAN